MAMLSKPGCGGYSPEVWLCPATPSVERHLHPIANRVVLRADVAYDATEVVACGARGRPRS